MENYGSGDEKPKHSDLEEEADEDDLLAQMDAGSALPCHHAASAALDEERQNVADDEEFRQPVDPDDRIIFPFCRSHQTAQGHVDCGREQGRRDENQNRLHDEWTLGRGIRVANRSSDIANRFGCGKLSLASDDARNRAATYRDLRRRKGCKTRSWS